VSKSDDFLTNRINHCGINRQECTETGQSP
jgi:hypothetical protein